MTEDPKNQKDVTPDGAVEVNEEALDHAAGGAAYLKMPVDQPNPKSGPGSKETVSNFNITITDGR
jgi:hypothetical protein